MQPENSNPIQPKADDAVRDADEDIEARAVQDIEARLALAEHAGSLETLDDFVGFLRELRLFLRNHVSLLDGISLDRYLTALENAAPDLIDGNWRAPEEPLPGPAAWRLVAGMLVVATSEFREIY
jgi:hypothetical protein